jgi:two-component system OmpR family sensor kinase
VRSANANQGANRTPIALQIVGMMIAALLASQLITIAIILFMPRVSMPSYAAGAVAGLLAGEPATRFRTGRLVRTATATAPSLPADRTHRRGIEEARLAALMHRPREDVRFYVVHDVYWLESLEDIWRSPPRPGRGPPPGPNGGFAPPPNGGPDGPFARPTAWLTDPEFPFFGRFVAAARNPEGRWFVVKPVEQPLVDEWQIRLALWLAGSVLFIAPAGYWFARRITAPLSAFARAARRLGSDPNSPPVMLDGPAELGDAADAFNDMQLRLRRYIADRTAMFSAISHDLRTPLARIRFKIERLPDGLKDSVSHDLDQMDRMIGSVLTFMRDGALTGLRNRVDLASLVELVADEAAQAGGDVVVEEAAGLTVTADVEALKRLFANIIQNAITHGGCARVSIARDGSEAIVEVRDEGPGLPESEFERVFEPFYRADVARNLDSGGVGLGLAIARSIAREHGGEVRLRSNAVGLSVIVQLPLYRDDGLIAGHSSGRDVRPKDAPID